MILLWSPSRNASDMQMYTNIITILFSLFSLFRPPTFLGLSGCQLFIQDLVGLRLDGLVGRSANALSRLLADLDPLPLLGRHRTRQPSPETERIGLKASCNQLGVPGCLAQLKVVYM